MASNNPLGRPSTYSKDEIEHGLAALVHFDGNAGKARDWLADKGIQIPADTLRYWKNSSHVRRYHELAEMKGQEYDERAVQRFKEMEAAASETAHEAISKAREALADNKLEPKEYGKLARDMAVTAGVASDKRLVIEGKPTVITQSKSAEELYSALGRLGQVIEGTAEEIESPRSIPAQTSESPPQNVAEGLGN